MKNGQLSSSISKNNDKTPNNKVRATKPEKDRIRRVKESQNLIKKGFNVCYALEEFIRASQYERDNE